MSFRPFKNFHQYLKKSLLAVDFGSQTVGLAIFTPDQDPYPLGYGSIAVHDELQLEKALLKIITQEQIAYLVFGLPLLADGGEGEMACKIKAFAHTIAQKSGLPILFQDEYLSTHSARERIQSSAQCGLAPPQIDQESAKIILEDFIRSNGVI